MLTKKLKQAVLVGGIETKIICGPAILEIEGYKVENPSDCQLGVEVRNGEGIYRRCLSSFNPGGICCFDDVIESEERRK